MICTNAVENEAIQHTRSGLTRALAESRTEFPAPAAPAGWALASDTLRLLAALVQHLRPKHILEFGSGTSTRVLAQACEQWNPTGRISSMEHDPVFWEESRNSMTQHELVERVSLQLAPLVARECAGRWVGIYHLSADALASSEPAELAIIDGPPAALGGREGTLYQILDHARPGTLVLLDDANRHDEREFIRRWQENLGDAVEIKVHPQFAKGLATIIVKQPVPRLRIWEHRFQLSCREIAEVIPPEHSFVVVDEAQWDVKARFHDRRVVRLFEKSGAYQGPPATGREAETELERLQTSGADYVVFGWPAYWWFESYPEVNRWLQKCQCIMRNERLAIYDLRR